MTEMEGNHSNLLCPTYVSEHVIEKGGGGGGGSHMSNQKRTFLIGKGREGSHCITWVSFNEEFHFG